MGIEPTYAALEAIKIKGISIEISIFDLYMTCTLLAFRGLILRVGQVQIQLVH